MAVISNLGSLRVGVEIPVKNWNKNYGKITADVKKYPKTTDKALGRAGKAWDKHAKTIKAASIGMVAFGAATVTALGFAVNAAGDFQQSMTNTQAVAGATSEELQKLTGFAREMGKQTVFSAKESADAMLSLASAGQDTNEIMNSLRGTLDLAAATNSDLSFASRTVASTLSQFSLDASEADRIANVFTATISASQANMDKLATSMSVVGPVAKSIGLSLEETTAILGSLFNAGLDASTAGTSLRQAIAQLLKPTDDAKEALGRLEVQTVDSSGALLSITDIIRQLETSGLKAADALAIFGVRAGPGMLALVSQGADAIEDLTAKVTGTNKAAEIAALQVNTFQGQVKLLKSAFSELQITIGNELLPTLTEYTTKITGIINQTSDWAAENPKLTKTLVTLTAAAGGFALVVGGLGLAAGPIAKGVGLIGKLGVAIKGLALAPAGIAIAGVTAGVGVFAAGLKLGTNAIDSTKKELLSLNKAMEQQRNNVAQIQRGVDGWTKQLDNLFVVMQKGGTHVSVLNKATGEWVDVPIAERAEFVRGRIANLSRELQKARGDFAGTTEVVDPLVTKFIALADGVKELASSFKFALPDLAKTTTKGTGEALEAWKKLLAETNKGTKEYSTFYDMLIGSFNEWTSITGEGFKASTAAQIVYLDELLESVETESAAWRGLNNLRADLRDQDILDQVGMAKDRLKIQNAVLDEQSKQLLAAARAENAALLRITKDGLAEIRKANNREQLDSISNLQDTQDKTIKIVTSGGPVIKKQVDETNRLMDNVNQQQINAGEAVGKRMVEATNAQVESARIVSAQWNAAAANIKGTMSDLFATMIDPSIETDWKQLWSSLKTIAIRSLADIVASEAFSAIGEIAIKLSGKSSTGAAIAKIFGTKATVTAASTGTASPTSSTAIGAISGKATLGTIFSAVAQAAIPIAAIATIIQSERDFRKGNEELDRQISKAVSRGGELNVPSRLLAAQPGLRESQPELFAALQESFQDPRFTKGGRFITRQVSTRAERDIRTRQGGSQLPQPIPFVPRRPEGTDRFGRPLAGTVSMAPGRAGGTVSFGDIIVNLDLPNVRDIRDLDSAELERVAQDGLIPAFESLGFRLSRSDNIIVG